MRILSYIDEIIALIIVISCVILIALHIDSEIKAILSIAAGYEFGKRGIMITQTYKRK